MIRNKGPALIKFVFIFYLSAWQVIGLSFLIDSSTPNNNIINKLLLSISDNSEKINFCVKNNETKVPVSTKSLSTRNHSFISNSEFNCVNEIIAVTTVSKFQLVNINLTEEVSPRSPPPLS